jgi:hypothetical protein
MNSRPLRTDSVTKAVSIVDCLVAGFGAFLRRPLAATPLVLLDLWLAYGARIAPRPLAEALSSDAAQRTVLANGGDPALLDSVAQAIGAGDVRTAGVATQLAPSLLSGLTVPARSGLVWSPAGGWELAAVLLALNLAAVLLTCLVLLPLVGSPAGARPWWRRIGPTAWTMVRTLLLIAAIGLLLGLPTVVGVTILLAISPLASELAGLSMALAGLALWLFASFSIEAVALGETRPVVALYQSYNLVRANPARAAGLALAAWVLVRGFAFLLQPLAASPAGMLAGSILYAILSCSVAGARLVYVQRGLALLPRIYPDPVTQ